MGNEDDGIQVVFNGEIYNFQELSGFLASKGHKFKTRSDTESIVHGYEQWGEGVFERLRGMFAIALWDGRNRKLLLARDRVGIGARQAADLPADLARLRYDVRRRAALDHADAHRGMGRIEVGIVFRCGDLRRHTIDLVHELRRDGDGVHANCRQARMRLLAGDGREVDVDALMAIDHLHARGLADDYDTRPR